MHVPTVAESAATMAASTLPTTDTPAEKIITSYEAAFSGNADALGALLDAGGAEAATAADPASGMTPLMLAALKGQLLCVAQLIDTAPEALNATDSLGRTVLMLAATGGSVEVIQLLHKHGAQIDATSRDGRTALIWAVEWRRIEPGRVTSLDEAPVHSSHTSPRRPSHPRTAPVTSLTTPASCPQVIAHKFWAVEALALLGADPETRELEGSGIVKPGGVDPPKSVSAAPRPSALGPRSSPLGTGRWSLVTGHWVRLWSRAARAQSSHPAPKQPPCPKAATLPQSSHPAPKQPPCPEAHHPVPSPSPSP